MHPIRVLFWNFRKDPSRVTYYNGGNYVPVASIDRRIRLLDVKSGKCEKTIVEHVGSVKSVYTDESRGFVLSGSYDTTIRYIYSHDLFLSTTQCQKVGVAVNPFSYWYFGMIVLGMSHPPYPGNSVNLYTTQKFVNIWFTTLQKSFKNFHIPVACTPVPAIEIPALFLSSSLL